MRQARFHVAGFDPHGKLTHSRLCNMPRVNQKHANRTQRKWLAWREQYLRDNPGDYPLRHTGPTVLLRIIEMATGKTKWFIVGLWQPIYRSAWRRVYPNRVI